MANYQIRLLHGTDYPALEALWRITPGMGIDAASDNEIAFCRFLARNPTLNYAAILDNALIGVAMCGEDGRRGTFYHVAVHPNYQKQGIAKALVSRCEVELISLGIKRARLMVLQNNQSGRNFWEKTGWQIPPQVLYYSKDLD